jgi:uncharacterized DUF497 family protein
MAVALDPSQAFALGSRRVGISRRIDKLRVNSTSVPDAGFTWDETKALENYAKHGVTFEKAREVFADPFAIEYDDDRQDYGEPRFVIIGMADGRLLFVAYTLQGETVRLISARGAEPHERRQYHEENS